MCNAGVAACKINVHKRCEKNVANNCGMNTREFAKMLSKLNLTGDKLNPSKRKKVGHPNLTLTQLSSWGVGMWSSTALLVNDPVFVSAA